MIKKILLIASILLSNYSFSQRNFDIHAGLSRPSFEFADGIGDDIGSARDGINIGIKYYRNFADKNFGFFGGVDFFSNATNSEIEQYFESVFNPEASLTHENYLNIPISLGLFHRLKLSKSISIISDLGLTFNYLRISDFKVELNDITSTVSYNGSNSLGFIVGSGILINELFSFKINYYGLGQHSVDSNLIDSTGTSPATNKQEVKIFTVTFGYRI